MAGGMSAQQVRQVIVDGSKRFVNNRVRTTKYTLLTFVPYFIYDQFSKPANIFFLIIASLQVINSSMNCISSFSKSKVCLQLVAGGHSFLFVS